MTLLQIPLSDELRARLEARAAEGGFGTIEQYARAVLEATADPGMTDDEVEELLLRRAQDTRPGIEMTPALKQQFLDEVRQRRQAGGSRP